MTTWTTAAPLEPAHWQRRLDELAGRHGVPGAALAVRRLSGDGDDELAEAATGVLNRRTGVEVTPDSVFQIGSISKVWTATLVMQLVDEGALDLDAPVADVLPGLRLGDPEVARRVTMRHLLTHTSGIDGDVFTDATGDVIPDTGRGDDVLERFVAVLADAPQCHPLGATFSYCNSGFSLAGRVVEVLTGTTWDTALRERVITPLGLARSSTLPEEAIRHRAAVGHLPTEPGGTPQPVPTFLLPRSAGPAGLVNASARDVTAFAAAHLRGGLAPGGERLLSAASVAAMQAHEVELPDQYSFGDSWGLGWMRFAWAGRRAVGHDGGTIGQIAYLRVLPGEEPGTGLAVALLTNGGGAAALGDALLRELFAELADVTLPGPFRPAPPAGPVAPARYVGSYRRNGVTTEVVERDGRLVARISLVGAVAERLGTAPQELELLPAGPDVFAAWAPGRGTWDPVVFATLPDGTRHLHHRIRVSTRAS